MKTLDDILFGFLIFFFIDRLIRLVSNGVIEPWAQKKTRNPNIVENWKLVAESFLLAFSIWIVYRNRHLLSKLDTS